MVLGLGWSVTCRVHGRFLIKAQLFIERNVDCSKLEFDFISGSFVHTFYLWTVSYYICNLKLAVKEQR